MESVWMAVVVVREIRIGALCHHPYRELEEKNIFF